MSVLNMAVRIFMVAYAELACAVPSAEDRLMRGLHEACMGGILDLDEFPDQACVTCASIGLCA